MMTPLPPDTYQLEEEAGPLRPDYRFRVRAAGGGGILMTAHEPPLRPLIRFLRFTDLRRTTPFDLRVQTVDGVPVARLTRGIPVASSRVRVDDGEGACIGWLRQRPCSIGGRFDVLDATQRPLCRLQGRPIGTQFTLLTPDDVTLATITKQWAGLGKELLTSADHYRVEVDVVVPPDPILRTLILAAGICIGLLVKLDLP